MKKLLTALVCSVALIASAPSTVMAAGKVVMSNDTSALNLKGQTFEVLAKELRERLGDDFPVEVHHSGALLDQKTQIQGLQLGSATFIAPTSGIYAPLAEGLNALTLPFLLTSRERVVEAWNDPVVREAFVPALQQKNIEPVAIWMSGQRELSYRGKDPILVPDDMKGIKIRVQSVPSDIEAFKAVGANVISMAWGEVASALQQGVIDAVEPTPMSLDSAGMVEVIDQMTKIGYQYAFYIVGANKTWWDGLSEEERASVEASLEVANQFNFENAQKENDAAYEKIQSAGKEIHTLSADQLGQWKEKMKPVWEEYGESIVGENAMERLVEISSSTD
jgi:C4-dicarboxylate-binding protein DctP